MRRQSCETLVGLAVRLQVAGLKVEHRLLRSEVVAVIQVDPEESIVVAGGQRHLLLDEDGPDGGGSWPPEPPGPAQSEHNF